MTKAKEQLIRCIEEERARLHGRWLFGGLAKRWPRLTVGEHLRLAAVEVWLLDNPPPDYLARCKHCYFGTGSPDGVCSGCRFS